MVTAIKKGHKRKKKNKKSMDKLVEIPHVKMETPHVKIEILHVKIDIPHVKMRLCAYNARKK